MKPKTEGLQAPKRRQLLPRLWTSSFRVCLRVSVCVCRYACDWSMKPRRMMMLMTTRMSLSMRRHTHTWICRIRHCGRGERAGSRAGLGVINNRQVAHALEHNYPLQRHVRVGVLRVRARSLAKKVHWKRGRDVQGIGGGVAGSTWHRFDMESGSLCIF